jgi:hemerythrin superfamily protein
MDAIELLKTQHAEIDALFEKLGHTSDETEWRDMVGRLTDRLKMHAAIEEEIFYPAVMEAPGGADLIGHARNEHRQMERFLEALREPDALKGACTSELRELQRTVTHHVAEEEGRIMPHAYRLGLARLRDLAQQMEARIRSGEVAELRAAHA